MFGFKQMQDIFVLSYNPNQCVGGSNVIFKVAKLWQGYEGIGGCQKTDNELKTWIASKIKKKSQCSL